jgi:hypothetical protein
MKASELRIGNLIYGIYENIEDEVDQKSENVKDIVNFIGYDPWDNFFWVEGTINAEFYESFEPIPLTEEWLVRFGFYKREGSVCDSFYIGTNPVTKDWMFDIVWLKNMMDYSYEDYPFYRNGYFKIQYVHHLQNLYFALTGEELKLTDK